MELENITKQKGGKKPVLIIECNGEQMSIKDYAKLCNITTSAAYQRYYKKIQKEQC